MKSVQLQGLSGSPGKDPPGEGLKAPPAPMLMFRFLVSREGGRVEGRRSLGVHKELKATNGNVAHTSIFSPVMSF